MKFTLQALGAFLLTCQHAASFSILPHQTVHRQQHKIDFSVQGNLKHDNRIVVLPMTGQSSGDDMNDIKANDGEALQALFSKYCDKDGLMTKSTLETKISTIKELLEVEDILQEELDDIWKSAPKFPDIDSKQQQRIDVDSFIQIYRDIDDIFEDDEGGEVEKENDASSSTNDAEGSDDNGGDNGTSSNVASTGDPSIAAKDGKTEEDADMEVPGDEKELEQAFKTICDDAGLVTKDALKNWSEVKELMDDNELGLDEFDQMWERTTKSPGSKDQLDVEGFLSFNVALDDLFEFDDDGDEVPAKESEQIAMFYADDLPPGVIFAEIADENLLVGMQELRKWGDLQDMLREEDLFVEELQSMYSAIPKAADSDKLNEEGFESLYEVIDALFEDDDDDDEATQSPVPPAKSSKNNLLSTLAQLEMDEERLPCGLEGTEDEVELVLEIASALEQEESNMMVSTEGEIQPSDIAGEWELMYTTSSTMKFNKSLTGMVPPNAKFGGLRQTFKASKYLADAEYVEKIEAGPASFEVKVTGDWLLKDSVSLFSGSKSVTLQVEPDKVAYGVTTQKADHWKSLGPLSLLDISYIDKDLRIMRGTTSTDSMFIFKRV